MLITPAPKPRSAKPAPRPPLDAAWQRWVVEQRLRGCTIASVLQVIESAGYSRADGERIIASLDGHPAYAIAQELQLRHRKLEAVALNLQRVWASAPGYGTVEKRADVSEDEFAARYVHGCRPVVLTGHARDWPALRRWSPQDLKQRFGHLDVDIQADRNADPKYEENKLQRTRRVRLGAFVDRVVQGSATNDYYLTANNEVLRRPEFAPLLDDIGSLPPLCDRAQLAQRSSFWFGPAGTVTPLHHDTLMLFHTQVVGRKRWRLLSPLEWPRMYNHSHVFSEVDLDRPDPGRFPAFGQATVLDVIVEPGETIFLPLGWWHQVSSLDVSLSFSYSCLAVENHFDYPDPAWSAATEPAAAAKTMADAMHADLVNAIRLADGGEAVEAQFADGSALQFRPHPSSIEVQVSRVPSLAAQHGEHLAGVARQDRAFQCAFSDGTSLRIVAFG